MPPTLKQWLALIEQRHPQEIDLGLERSRVVAERLGLQLNVPVITVGGTNGKGSTCAMLEAILLQAGYRVALYIKPHFVHFNERARLNGALADDAVLIAQFAAVEQARSVEPAVSLTYYEFTTLAILRWFSQQQLDVVILEVGLGGRLDTVNLIAADCAIVTSIDIDHAQYLGNTREAIGYEKAAIYRPGRPAVCGDPFPPQSLIDYAQQIGADLWRIGRDFNYSGDRNQWNFSARGTRRNSLAYPALRGANQLLNASAALAGLEALRDRLPVSQQAVRSGLALVELPGRFQVLPGRPTVVLDVAHNPHAAAALAQNLDNMGFYRYTYAIFGCMRDKDIHGIVAPLINRVDHWLCTDLPIARAACAQELIECLQKFPQILEPKHSDNDQQISLDSFASPACALANARERASESDRIVVLGSFHTVAGVMQSFAHQEQHQ